jgi:hypothetical protein
VHHDVADDRHVEPGHRGIEIIDTGLDQAGARVEGPMGQPEAIAQRMPAGRPRRGVLGRNACKRKDVGRRTDRKIDRHDGRAALLQREGDEAGRGADLQDGASRIVDAAEIGIEAGPQVPIAR